MKKYFRFLSFIFAMIGLIVLASCGDSTSGIKGSMSFTSTKDSIKIDVSFDANSNLKNGLATTYIQCYVVEDDEVTYKTKQNLSLDSSYVHATTTFTSLEIDTEYEFVLKATYEGNDEVVDKQRKKTLSKGVTSDEAIEITTTDEFLDIVNDPDAHYTLMNDLDFEGAKIADLFDSTNKFTGSFDGRGYVISNFKISSTKSTKYLGLFGYTDGAEISNLKLMNVVCESLTITTAGHVGAVAGWANNTTFTNINVDGFELTISCNSTSTLNLGSVVGYANACYFESVNTNESVLTVNSARLKVCAGLFAGMTTGINEKGLAKDVSVSGSLTIKPTFTDKSKDVAFVNAGGFIGENDCKGLIENCFTLADVVIERDASNSSVYFDLNLGGFIGYTNSSNNISKCAAIVDLSVYAGKAPVTNDDVNTLNNTILTTKKAYIGGFIGNLNQVIVGIRDSWFVPKHYGITVYCKQNEETKDSTDENATSTTVEVVENVFISFRYAYSNESISTKTGSLYVYEAQVNTKLSTVEDCSLFVSNDISILSDRITDVINNREEVTAPTYASGETPSTDDTTTTPTTGDTTVVEDTSKKGE